MTTTLALAQTTLARLQTLPSNKITIYEGRVPTTPASAYIAYYPGGGNCHDDGRQAQSQSALDWSAMFVCCGSDPQQCLWVVDQMRALLYGWSPDTSESATPFIEVVLGNPVLPDDSVPLDVRYSFTLQFILTTTRS